MKKLLPFLLAPLLLSACATPYENAANQSWDLMKRGEIDKAIKLYDKTVTSDKEKLLRLMDEGILLRVGKRYAESNEKFFAAAKIIDMNGYINAGEQAVTLLTNEKQTVYQGEDFEKVLIHVYLGLNYLSLNDLENAVVETRRVNEILFKMISEAKRPYELNAFARYLNALLFENEGEENDAFVDYKNTLKIDPSLTTRFPVIREDLMRLAKKMGFDQELSDFKKKFGQSDWENTQKILQNHDGSIVLLYESGKSPEKYSSREKHVTEGKGGTAIEVMIPVTYYRKRPSRIQKAELSVNGQTADTVVLNDIESTAIKHLQDRMGRMIAKALLTAAVKAGIATGIGKATGSEELGLLAGIALFLASEADTRSWLLLPGALQVAKIYVPPGKYDLTISYLDNYNHPVSTETVSQIEVKPNHATFLQRRSFD